MAKKKRKQVESCVVLDLGAQKLGGLLETGCGPHLFDATHFRTGLFFVHTPVFDTEEANLIIFRTVWDTGEFHLLAPYRIGLERVPTNFGGHRTWLKCPLEVNSKTCGKQARKLYLPPGKHKFGCRKCHDLAYRASQETPIPEEDAGAHEEEVRRIAEEADRMINCHDAAPAAITSLLAHLDTPAARRKRKEQFRELQEDVRHKAHELAVFQGYAEGTFQHAFYVESWLRKLELYDPERFYDSASGP
jgi:hypothetical protein